MDRTVIHLRVVGKKFLNFRIALGLTQDWVAKRFGIAVSTLRLFEQGKTDLSPRLQAKLICGVQDILPEFRDRLIEPEYMRLVLELFEGGEEAIRNHRIEEMLNRDYRLFTGTDPWMDRFLYKSVLGKNKLLSEANEAGANLMASVSQDLLARFNKEKEVRKLTSSELLELILTFYFQCQALFSKNKECGVGDTTRPSPYAETSDADRPVSKEEPRNEVEES